MNSDDPIAYLAKLATRFPLSKKKSRKVIRYIDELGLKPWVAYLLAHEFVDRDTALQLTQQHQCYNTILFNILDEKQSCDVLFNVFIRQLSWHDAILKATKAQSQIQLTTLAEYHKYDQYDSLLMRNRPKHNLDTELRHPNCTEPHVEGDFYSRGYRLPGSFGSRKK